MFFLRYIIVNTLNIVDYNNNTFVMNMQVNRKMDDNKNGIKAQIKTTNKHIKAKQ
jgi:hypothetical protein